VEEPCGNTPESRPPDDHDVHPRIAPSCPARAASQNTEFTIKLKQLEDELLFKLSNAEGDITEDVALIESLEESKRVATEINEKVCEGSETSDECLEPVRRVMAYEV
jgi:hypothetical protein